MPIIESLLDQDLYKLTMCQAYFHKFPNVTATFEFKCRNKGINLSNFADTIEDELMALEHLRFEKDELEFLAKLRFIKPDYIEFLREFRLDPKQYLTITKKPFAISVKGPVARVSMFEIFVLSIVNEVYFRKMELNPDYNGALRLLEKKISIIKRSNQSNPIVFSEFGTRRRRSKAWQRQVLDILKYNVPNNIIGTSNVYYAKELGMKTMGTMAHEFLQAAQALTFLPDAQQFAFRTWAEEYQGDLGIALSDVWGMDAFFADFNLLYSKLFDGCRHDSGDPFTWCRKLIKHYQRFGIDPKTKTALFSDSIDFPLAFGLAREFGKQIKVVFGIGTNLTNNIPDSVPLNIVMKMTECNGWPVAKLSDAPGKTMCKNKEFMTYLQYVINQKINC